jgi:hypothetical protein
MANIHLRIPQKNSNVKPVPAHCEKKRDDERDKTGYWLTDRKRH